MFGLSDTQFRVLVSATALFLTTITSILPDPPVTDPLKVIIVGVIAAIAGYIVPKE